uniref:Receptor ligand binding region domain-containing protein n=1 Tax=Timema poppense TaxID=170557 RepID=A0A7R9CRR9_TIMPO|nr:unnamed protein product [Timema poppensis]
MIGILTNGSDSLIYNIFTGTGAHNFCSSVTFGFLATYATTPVALGAVPLAVDAVNTDPRLLPGRTLHYLAADIGTSPHRGHSSVATLAIRAMTAMRDSGTVAFIGPGDTCRAEALVAAAWNLPMIAYVGTTTPPRPSKEARCLGVANMEVSWIGFGPVDLGQADTPYTLPSVRKRKRVRRYDFPSTLPPVVKSKSPDITRQAQVV